MGFTDGSILLDHENGTYNVGETVQGKLVFDLSKLKSFRGIYVSIKGFCRVHWTTSHSRRVNDRTERYTKTHESHEEYLNQKIYVVGGSDGETSLKPGHYEFPFACALPPNIPPSFEGSVGHIRYEIKAVVDRAFKFDQELFRDFDVKAPYDLNTNYSAKEPLEFEIYQKHCCWCMSYGSSEIIVKVPTSGFCVGQKIPIEVACNNDSKIEIEEIKFSVSQMVEYKAVSEPATKVDGSKIAKLVRGPIPANTTKNWTLEMEVPEVSVCNLDACQFIDVRYHFKVDVTTPWCHEDSSETQYIYFGTTPIFEPKITGPVENMQNVSALNTPSVPPITNQPSPYPNRSPYPGNANTPYPGITVSPYPTNQTISYPGNPTNYPNPDNAADSPYPGKPPYSNVSPYPGAIHAFPTGSPLPPNSYPPNPNLPFPGTNSPYPGAMPYPPANPPYPVVPSPGPYPAVGPSPAPYPARAPSPVPYPAGAPSPAPYPARGPSPVPYPAGAPSPAPYPVPGQIGFATPNRPEVTVTNPSDPFSSASAPPQ